MKNILIGFIKFFLSVTVIFFGAIIIAIAYFPKTDNQSLMASNFGEALVPSTLIVLFFWGAYGSYKKWKRKDIPEELPEAKRKHLTKKLIIMAGIIVVVSLFFVWVLTYDINKATKIQSNTKSQVWTETQKSSLRKGMLDSCGNGGTIICNCLADYFINNYTLDDMTIMVTEMKKTGKPTQAYTDAVNSCTSK